MINLSKIESLKRTLHNVNCVSNVQTHSNSIIQRECNLNFQPSSYLLPSDLYRKAKITLAEFYKEYGEVKSSTYICEKLKQAREAGNKEAEEELWRLRMEYSPKVKLLRKFISPKKQLDYDEYIKELKSYIKENGAYINCQECADIMCYDLRNKGINANNVLLYTTNKENVRVSKAEHVFTIAGISRKATDDPETWGNCYIVDAWSGICMPLKNGIDFYKDFFGINPEKHNLKFELFNK